MKNIDLAYIESVLNGNTISKFSKTETAPGTVDTVSQVGDILPEPKKPKPYQRVNVDLAYIESVLNGTNESPPLPKTDLPKDLPTDLEQPTYQPKQVVDTYAENEQKKIKEQKQKENFIRLNNVINREPQQRPQDIKMGYQGDSSLGKNPRTGYQSKMLADAESYKTALDEGNAKAMEEEKARQAFKKQYLASGKTEVDLWADPNYKLDSEEKKRAKEHIKKTLDKLPKDWLTGKMTPENQKIQHQMQALQVKISPLNSAAVGTLNSVPFYDDLQKARENEIAKNGGVSENFNSVIGNAQTQNPIAYGAGYFGGKTGQYAVGGQLMSGVPLVGKAGAAVGSGVAKLTGGKVAADVAGRVATNLIGDTALDVILDTAPEVISNIQQGKSTSDIAKAVVKNIGINLSFNIAPEVLIGGFKQIRKVMSADNAAELAKQVNVLDDVSKQALATENKMTVKELQSEINDIVKVVPRKINTSLADRANLNISNPTNRQLVTIPEKHPSMANVTVPPLPFSKGYDDMMSGTGKQIIDRNSTGVAYAGVDINGKPIYEPVRPKGEPVVPKGMKERGYAQSVRTKSDMSLELKQEYIDNPNVYKALSNDETFRAANKILDTGIENARAQFDNLASVQSPIAIPLGYNLAKQYMKNGNSDAASTVLRAMSKELTKSGQFSQAAAMTLMKESPETAARYLQKQLDAMNIQGQKSFGNKWKNFALNSEEMKAFGKIEPYDTDSIVKIFREVGDRVAKEYPSTFKEKATEIMHTAMLLNPKTQVRNVLSNVVMLPASVLSQKASALGQGAAHLIKPDFKPNQAFFVGAESKEIARKVYESVKEQLGENLSSKWESSAITGMKNKEVFKQSKIGGWVDSSVKEASKNWTGKSKQIVDSVFNGKAATENLRQFTYDLLEKGDTPFVKKNFESRLSSYIQAQGIKGVADVSDDAIAIATTEAMKATFKDDNAISSLFQSLKNKTGLFGELILPFAKTPANIMARTVEYGPIGLVKSMTSDLSKLKLGKITANEVIDNVSKGLVGSSAIGLGVVLYNQGIITGPQSENGKKAEFEKQQGFKPYAFKVDGKYYPYDWAQPAASGLVMGATIAKTLSGGDDKNIGDAGLSAATAYGDTLLNTSLLQNVNDILGGYGSPTEKLIQETYEMPLRAIPAVLGAGARASDNMARATYSKGDRFKTLGDTVKSKIPGLSKTLPEVYDTWGKVVKRQDSDIENVLQQFVLPWNTGSGTGTKLDSEVSRLYNATKKESVFPNKAEYTIDGVDLDNEQRSRYQKSMGEKSYRYVENAMGNENYKMLTDIEKVEVLSSVYSLARDIARSEVIMGRPLENQYAKKLSAAQEYANSMGVTVDKAVSELAIAKSYLDNTADLTPLFTTEKGKANKNGKLSNLTNLGYSWAQATEVYDLLK